MSHECQCGNSPAAPVDLAFVDQVIQRLGTEPRAAIAILQAIQEHYHYLPREAMERVCQLTRIRPADLAGVSTFYAQFRHRPAGRHTLRVCHGTACHVKGSELVDDAVRRYLHLTGDQDTDAAGQFTVERAGCLGCCTLAPVVQIDGTTYGHLSPESAPKAVQDFLHRRDGGDLGRTYAPPAGEGGGAEIRIGVGSCCVAGGSMAIRDAVERAVRRSGARVTVKPVGCIGMCHQTPLVEVSLGDGKPSACYARVAPDDAAAIVHRHFPAAGLLRRVSATFTSAIDRLLTDETWEPVTRYALNVREGPVCDFLGRQKRIATESCGRLDPLDLGEYQAHDGWKALRQCLAQPDPQTIIDTITRSGLRGRGGAGFPTGRKWAAVRAAPTPAPGAVKYVICNGDEGDPGAFMDRMLLESFPYRVLEGLAIAAVAVGAAEGVLYIRAEYPEAVRRIREAIRRCEERGILGPSMLGSGRALSLTVMEGAGAFVCGEETALIASIEGKRGTPRLRPPYPAEEGLWGKPTCVNNVETLALVPWIIRQGAEAFAAVGTATSKGTKVFSLTGKIARGGLIEVPMGVTIRQIVEEIGGSVAGAPARTFKAVQIGGPSGGCVPASLADTPIDYESLAGVGAIMGSGGLVVLDDRDCMVEIARYFLHFTQTESCGQCSFCRVGTRAMLDILDRLCTGKARRDDLSTLEDLARTVSRASVCGLGQTAPNPVLSTLRYFRDEYEAHLHGRCPAGRCKALIQYRVNDKCIGCTRCAQHCPEDAIPMRPFERHTIDSGKCTRCDLCRQACPVEAIEVA